MKTAVGDLTWLYWLCVVNIFTAHIHWVSLSTITRPSTRLDNLLLLAVQSFSDSSSRKDKFGKKLNITLNNFKLLYINVFRELDQNLILAKTLTFSPAILDYYNLLLLLLLLLQVIPVKVNYNYFTLYKASSLNLKIIWSKRVSFFVFLRCRISIRRSHNKHLPICRESFFAISPRPSPRLFLSCLLPP